MARCGVFPGSFDPLTVAHLAIADAVHEQCGLDRLDLVISRDALGKQHRTQTPISTRLRAIEGHARTRPWLHARSTDDQLLADIAHGYDLLVVGADKWHQLHDLAFYGSTQDMQAALARLPIVAVAARAGHPLPQPDETLVVVEVDESHRHVSSTAVRGGRHDWRA